LITEARKVKKPVGLAAMVMVDGQLAAAAAHGERKTGRGVPAAGAATVVVAPASPCDPRKKGANAPFTCARRRYR
jgi:hypothetical protein